MSISLKTALYNVGNLYNKKEMSQYLAIIMIYPLIILTILGFVSYSVIVKISQGGVDEHLLYIILSFLVLYIFIIIVSLIVSIFVNGIYINAMHNAISGKSPIFPSLIKDFLPILKTGGVFLCCTIAASMACSVINQIVSSISGPLYSFGNGGEGTISAVSYTVAMIFATAIYLFQLVFMWLMMISFSRKMKFSQYFDLKWCTKFLKKKAKELTMLGVYNILLSVPIIAGIFALAIYIVPLFKNMQDANPASFISPIVISLVMILALIVYYYYIQILNIDMIAQTIRDKSEKQI